LSLGSRAVRTQEVRPFESSALWTFTSSTRLEQFGRLKHRSVGRDESRRPRTSSTKAALGGTDVIRIYQIVNILAASRA